MPWRLVKRFKSLLFQSKKPRWPGKQPPLPLDQPGGGSDIIWESTDLQRTPVSPDLQANIRRIREIMGQNMDFVLREFTVGPKKVPAVLVYVSSLVEQPQINDVILRRLMLEYPDGNISLSFVKQHVVNVGEVTDCGDFWRVSSLLMDGEVVLFLAGEKGALGFRVLQPEGRVISEATTESVVRGPRDAFVEDIQRNVMLIRRRIKSPNMVVERYRLGRLTQTAVGVVYIKGLAAPELVQEVAQRLERIDVDAVSDSSFIEEMMLDSPLSVFPQMLATERPDRVCAALLEGKVALLVDNSPFSLVVPATLVSLLQAAEDYYHPYGVTTAIRWLRFFAFLISISGTALFVAIITFHQEMIPFRLVLSIASSREGVPLPAVLEALVLETTFELLREAGIRLPQNVGQAISIVGALVIGQAAVTAGLVSPLMVIVVAFTGIASFAIPVYELAMPMRLLRFPLLLLAGVLGLFGWISGLLVVLIHMAGLRSFGVPYLSPLSPLKFSELKDVVIRVPFWAMRTRPDTSKRNWYRMAAGLKPGPPPEEHEK